MTEKTKASTHPAPDASHAARRAILAAALPHAAFDGWTSTTLRKAVKAANLPDGAEALYFPDGPVELIGFWASECDAAAQAHLAGLDLTQMKIRQKITQGVAARLTAIGPHGDAAKRALAKLSLPSAGSAGPRSLWAAADSIWRAIGDTSRDANYYSKRAVLSAVIAATLPVWLADNDPAKTKARAFLDERIENVMQFEKVKAKARDARAMLPDPVSILAGLRFGRKGRRR